jgi:hypothetical protein
MTQPIAWLEVLKVAATMIASGVAAWVAWSIGSSQRDIAKQQADTAGAQRAISQAKLNLDLFEERYAIFHQVWGFLSAALDDTADVPHPLRPEFTNLIPKARFLFGKQIAEYMGEAHQRRVNLWTVLREQQRTGNGLVEFQGMTVADLQLWFAQEATNCFKRFADYLDFSAWKADPVDRVMDLNAAWSHGENSRLRHPIRST